MGEPVGEPPEPPESPESPVRRPAGRAGLIGALLCLAAAALTMISMFQDLVVAENFVGPQSQTYRITLWDAQIVSDGVAETASDGNGPSVPQNGVPLLFAAALLLTAVLLGTLDFARRFSRLAVVVAATFLTAAVAMVIPQALWWLDILEPAPITPHEGVDVEITVSLGSAMWLLVGGVALAAVGAVLTWRQPRPDAERVEPPTPRIGIPVIRRLPDEPPDAEN